MRGHKVLLDEELAEMYGVEVKGLNQAVKRNLERFPRDFMFQLTAQESAILRSQIVTLRSEHGRHRKYRPYAFTEQGIAMLSSVLRSARAARVNVEIMRAFVRLRRALAAKPDIARRVEALERRLDVHIRLVLDAIRGLPTRESTSPARRIGFEAAEKRGSSSGGRPRAAFTR